MLPNTCPNTRRSNPIGESLSMLLNHILASDLLEEIMQSEDSLQYVSRLSDSLCYPQYTASLKCLEDYKSDKSKCQEQFDVYKECKKKEVRSVRSCVLPRIA
ncbi:hypothetical protein Syun_027616 [Stephania yunnanensis]|uniref:CHCH domain-containing protein n=1 Tax=Stephania yunnanensis TaxID=152371 RepID=A0AAP0EI98_9MAGN